jgi:glycosyltransferase involved in cell wall biosynthesis
MTRAIGDTGRMLFSLVLGTVGRTSEVERFLRSLHAQHCREFELIVVDQNADDRLRPILAAYAEGFPVRHVRSERGLSRARNAGLAHVRGSLVAFPDDDCWYPADLLARVAGEFAVHPEWDGITGRSVDEHGVESGARFLPSSAVLSLATAWYAISYAIFLRRRVVDSVGAFDETLGVGAGTAYGSGEETDYVIRAIRAGHVVRYSRQIVVHHPNPVRTFDAAARRRGYSYGCGMGRVLDKHRYPRWQVAQALVRPAGGAVVAAVTGRWDRARYYANVLSGRLRGLRG